MWKSHSKSKRNLQKKAQKAGLSLSEWIVTTLDIYLEQEELKERNKNQVYINRNSEKEKLVYYYCKESLNKNISEKPKKNIIQKKLI